MNIGMNLQQDINRLIQKLFIHCNINYPIKFPILFSFGQNAEYFKFFWMSISSFPQQEAQFYIIPIYYFASMQYKNIGNMRAPQNYQKNSMAYSQFLSPHEQDVHSIRSDSKKFTTFQSKQQMQQSPSVPAFLQNRRIENIQNSMVFHHSPYNQSSSLYNPFTSHQDTKLPFEDYKKRKDQAPSFLKNDSLNLKDQPSSRNSQFERVKSTYPMIMTDKVLSTQNLLKTSGNIKKTTLQTSQQIFSPYHPKKLFSNNLLSPTRILQNKEPSIFQKDKDQKSDEKSTITNSQKSYKVPQFIKKGSPINKSKKDSDSEKLKTSEEFFVLKKFPHQNGSPTQSQSIRDRKSSVIETRQLGFKNYVETQSFSKKLTNNLNSASFAKISNTPQSNPVKLQNVNFEFGRLSSPSSLLTRRRIESTYQQKKFSRNDFDFMDKIGKGAFGDVYISRQKVTGFVCVLKKIQKKRIREQKLQESLLRQIKIQSYLNHRHLTTLYGCFSDQQHVYLILQLLPQGSLSQMRRKRRVSELQASRYLRQVCQGLRYMHKQQVIHRDLKPQNILMCNDYLKVGDFGCAIHTHTLRTTIVGCIAYISPEQLNNQSYDEKIDAWSVGVLTYQLVTGKSPFENNLNKINSRHVEITHLKLEFPSHVEISSDCRSFIANLLALDPNQRMTIDQALKHSFITKYFDQDRKNQQQVFASYLTL